MAFPQAVLEAKERLKISSQNFNDKKPLYETLCKLTEPPPDNEESDDKAYYLADYEAMWVALEKHSHPDDIEDGHWVLAFIHAVLRSSQLPPYHYFSRKENQAAIDKIRKLSANLEKLYKDYDLDAQIVLNNERLLRYRVESKIPNLYVYEDLHDIEKISAGSSDYFDEKKSGDFISFSKTLNFFADRSIKKIQEALDLRGNTPVNVHAIRFVRNMGRHTRISYEQPLNEVISVATFALYRVFYMPADISNLLNRGRLQSR